MAQLMTLPKINNSYLPGVDGLRAIAVLAVIIYHIKASLLPGGFSGVDVFFVISGYVVSASLAREQQTGFARFALHFYARRIIRIYPALIVCLVCISVMSTLIITSSWVFLASIKTALAAFFGVSNIALVLFKDGYFAPRVEFNPFTHTWSLGAEEQFYLLFPVIFYTWLKGRHKSGLKGLLSNWLLAGLLILSLYYSWVATRTAPDYAYYLLPSRFWELASGAMLFKLHEKKKFLTESVATANLWMLVGLIMVCLAFMLSDQNSFPFPWALLSVSGTMLVIAGVKCLPEKGTPLSHVLDNRFMIYIGKISYSLYLWHWPILVGFRWTVGLQSILTVTAAISLTVMMSSLSFHYLEVPARKNRFVAARSDWQIISLGSAIIACCFLVSIAVFKAQPYISLSKTASDKLTWYPHQLPAVVEKNGASQKLLKSRKLFAVGDSHCAAYGTLLEMLRVKNGLNVHTVANNGCSVANLLEQAAPDHAKRVQSILTEIEKLAEPNDMVFLASFRSEKLADPWSTVKAEEIVNRQKTSEAATARAQALREADAIITRLEKKQLIVIIDAPKPVFLSPPFRCSDWFNTENPVCANGFSMERDFLLDYRQPVMDSLQTLSLKHKKLIVWDPFPVLCPQDKCSAYDGENPLFFDDNHLSAYGGSILYPSFLALINGLQQRDLQQ